MKGEMKATSKTLGQYCRGLSFKKVRNYFGPTFFLYRVTTVLNRILLNRRERKDRKEIQRNGVVYVGRQSRSFACKCVPKLELGNEEESPPRPFGAPLHGRGIASPSGHPSTGGESPPRPFGAPLHGRGIAPPSGQLSTGGEIPRINNPCKRDLRTPLFVIPTKVGIQCGCIASIGVTGFPLSRE